MPNRLAAEASPYLRQHADNPVDWWPWSASALEAARAQGKPILLSIGYSACHWCHVMAHESFEDGATAALMNDLYICVKVDREERPDIDKIYQLAHQALTRRAGGWPLTVFLTPDDHLPFYAGTYFPREARYGMPPFAHVLHQVHAWWDTRREEVRAQNAALAEFLADHGKDSAIADALHDAPLARALTQIEAHFDSAHGGHLGAPKFPHCTEMELLLDLDLEPLLSGSTPGAPPFKVSHERDNPGPHPALRATSSPGENGQAPALRPRDGGRGKQMVLTTLHHIAAGGIHDQIGGGFARYSVDERWEIPHFEKMLYDNAQLLPLYSRLASHAAQFADAADGIVTWLGREMTAPDGGFYSALDADSEHEEGKFYVWQRAQVRALLGDDEYPVALRYYGFDRPANFENHAWNPIVARSLDDVAAELGIDRDRAQTLLSRARAVLFEARSARVRPGLDDKILTAWNALMIGALARASRTVQGAQATAWLTLAERALDCVQRSAWRDGRLYAKAGSDAQRFPGYLDDHAFLLDALLELLQCRWSERDFAWALQLAQQLLERFEDRVHGGFYFTAHDHEQLIQRPKPWSDEATPSGNGVAARALQRLGHLLGDTRYLDAAERTLRAGFDTLQQMPQACCSLLRALGDLLAPRTHVVVRCADAAQERDWRAALAAVADRRTDVYFVPAATSGLLGALAAQAPAASGIAYICRGTHCLPPVRDADAAATLLREGT